MSNFYIISGALLLPFRNTGRGSHTHTRAALLISSAVVYVKPDLFILSFTFVKLIILLLKTNVSNQLAKTGDQ